MRAVTNAVSDFGDILAASMGGVRSISCFGSRGIDATVDLCIYNSRHHQCWLVARRARHRDRLLA